MHSHSNTGVLKLVFWTPRGTQESFQRVRAGLAKNIDWCTNILQWQKCKCLPAYPYALNASLMGVWIDSLIPPGGLLGGRV